METASNRVVTEAFTIDRINADVEVVCWSAGLTLTRQLVADSLEARKRLAGGPGYAAIIHFPQDMDIDLEVLGQDLYREVEPVGFVRVMAVVCEALLQETLVKLYYAYFPPGKFAVRIFTNAREATSWVDERVQQRAAEGAGFSIADPA